MADKEEKPGLFNWGKIKETLTKSTAGKPKDDAEPTDEPSDEPGTDDGDGEEYEDASKVVKALTDKIESLEETIEVMAKAQTSLLDMIGEINTLQKSIGQGVVAIMDRTEEVLASPAPRKGAVSQLETALAKSMAGGGGAASGGGGTTEGRRLKPFTQKTIDMTKDILTKAVSDGEIDITTCGKYETQMNKSVGKANFAFTDDFVEFIKKHTN
jgi:hypothetical protein